MNTLALDFGSRYIGIALVDHPEPGTNRVLYAATLVVEPKPLNALVENRAGVRRLRRTRKTHKRRLRRLAQALQGIPNADHVVRFCDRRGYSYDEQEVDPETRSFQSHRSVFFEALREEVARSIPAEHQARVLASCSKHLNEDCRRTAELRPARFENRGPTRCNWQGCDKLVPQAEHDFAGRLRQSLFAWLLPVFGESPDRDKLRRSVDHWVGELDGLARALHKAADKEERKPLNKRVNRVYRNLLERVGKEATFDVAEKFREDWKEHYRRILSDVVRGAQGGRVRYCRQHSVEYVDYLLAGKKIPNREDITEADLVSRKQQIIFRRLWRLVEARLLPLAGGRIDRVIVERVAFDLLAGPFKDRQKLSEEKAKAMYWHGPSFGFEDRLEMLRKEFGGRCAYCGQPGITEQVEHLLPRSSFPFDSYFNLLPACTSCNTRKGARTALAAGMRVHDDAYQAYADYVRQKKPPHVYHTVKKGLLNLLRRSATADEAERRLAMLANDLVTATATQRGPRPLARYLATRLEQATGKRPEIAYRAGRHTALYRWAMLPEVNKQEMKGEGDDRNHAIDAIVLGCDLPSATALENKDWKKGPNDIWGWREKVQAAAPGLLEGLPRVEPVAFVPFFEDDLGGGYCRIELSAFNWNRGRKATHVLDPFGATRTGLPLKRKPASAVLANLKDETALAAQVEAIANPGLRRVLQKDPEHADEKFVAWLQQTIRESLKRAEMSAHPADRARRKLLEQFVGAPVEKVVAGEEAIPPTVGVRCVIMGSRGKLGVTRVGKDGKVFQHYQADPVVRELYVGYRLKDGAVDRGKPAQFAVGQVYEMLRLSGGRRVPVYVDEDSALRGRPQGSRGPRKDFLARWRKEFDAFCHQEGLVEVHRITQGCVIEKEDGTIFQLRNFDKGGEWMRADSFKGIMRVHRSPLRAITRSLP